MKKNLIVILITFLFYSASLFSQDKGEQIKDKSIIKDNSIIAPESLYSNINDLLHNWQIDLSKSQSNCINGLNVVFSDSVYMNRLYNLPTEMELSYNPVVKSYIDMYTVRRRDLVSYMLSLGEYYYPMFEEVLDKYDLPTELKYLPVIESALNPVAVSRMGATGLWQFMLRTGKQYHLEVNSLVDERRDPYKATEAAARYLKDLYEIYKDWNLVIASYNCGPGNVNKAIARSGGVHDYWGIYYNLPKETRGYVPAFIAANYVMNYYNEHQICPQEALNDLVALDTVHIKEEIHFKQISAVLDISIEDIRRYNPQFKKDIIPGNFKSYALVLPTNLMYAFVLKKDEITEYNKNLFFAHRKQTLDNMNNESMVAGNYLNTYYRVKKGDTLGAIARRNRTTVANLQRMNGMRNSKLSIGRRLIVKQVAKPEITVEVVSGDSSVEIKKKYYKIRSGDTLSAIASRNNTTVAELQKLNGLTSSRLSIGNNLVVGQETIIVEKNKEDKAEEEVKFPYIEPSLSMNSSEILLEYLNKVEAEQKDKLTVIG